MRDFLLNSEELLDKDTLAFLQSGDGDGLFPCEKVYFNDKIKLAYFTDPYTPIGELLPHMTLDEVRNVETALLERVRDLEENPHVSLETIIWDVDSIYLDTAGSIHLICLPTIVPDKAQSVQIYTKRIYALLEEMTTQKEGGEEVRRQINYQKDKQFGEWENLKEAIVRTMPEVEEAIVLKSINTPQALAFIVGHGEKHFRIGTDAVQADGVITGVETVSPLHAELGWNEINYFVSDLDSENGTFVNDQKIAPNTEVPIGRGTILRFADCTFNVE